MGKGICIAGNLIVDKVYPVNGWPGQGELVHILDGISRSTGGVACNTTQSLANLDPQMPIYVAGRIGADEDGDYILEQLHRHANIDTSRVLRGGITPLTLAMSDVVSKARTFFTYLGASGQFCEEDIDWDNLDCDILHIGYILLLNALDQEDPEYGTRMARLLHTAQQRGIRTSIDVVSEASDRFRRIVPPALKYTDYCIINEIEAGETTGLPLRDEGGNLLRENLLPALKRMKEMGVSTWAVIHSPEGGFGLDENNNYVALDSLKLPEGFIKASVGAGDAFCAGVLCGAEHGEKLEDAIALGIAAAAASLSDESASDGVGPVAEVRELYRKYR